jgi:large repetitive protein
MPSPMNPKLCLSKAWTTILIGLLACSLSLAAGLEPARAKEISLWSNDSKNMVSKGGETLFGSVTDPGTALGVMAKVNDKRKVYVTVDQKTGQFAMRLFDEETRDKNVEIEATVVRELGSTETRTFKFKTGKPTDVKVNALNRLTFGASPALFNRVDKMSFKAYLSEQLAPWNIADSAVAGMNLDALLQLDEKDDWRRDQGLQEWRIANAAYSEKQLQWVMTLFWENHFWSIPKRDWLIDGQLEEIRAFHANALGRFEDLLMISMKSPVMMDYLDNASSEKDAITENYARELLELHTVGVDGGYSNEDIRAVADILTGWTVEEIDHPSYPGTDRKLTVFKFDPTMHDGRPKQVSFLKLDSPGAFGPEAIGRGEALSRALARSAKTRKFICGKLVAQFVSEDKPKSAMKTCDAAWKKSGGTIGAVLRALVLSDDFNAPENIRSKAKTPFEFLVSAIRNFGLYENRAEERYWGWDLVQVLEAAGVNMKTYPVPTGFKEQSTKWLSTASMNGRIARVTSLVSQTWNVKRDYIALVRNAGLRSPEAIAAYLLTIATSDRYRSDEFQSIVEALRGSDRLLDVDDDEDLERSVERAVGLIVALPSYQIQ